jgi:hypothetical protein
MTGGGGFVGAGAGRSGAGDAGHQGLARLVRREGRHRFLGAALDCGAGAVLAGAVGAIGAMGAMGAMGASGAVGATGMSAAGGAIGSMGMSAAGGAWWGALGGAALGGAAGIVLGGWHRRGALRPALADVARHLDATVPRADWSADLLAAWPESLQPLERLQRARVLDGLAAAGDAPLPNGTWGRPLMRLGVAMTAAAALLLALSRWGDEGRPPRRARSSAPASAAAAGVAAAIVRSRVEVEPPAYTRLPPRRVEGWAVRAEEGARVRFEVEVRGAVDGAALRFGDEEVPLARGGGGVWRGEVRAQRSELYAFHAAAAGHEVLHGPLSRLDVTRDQPPTLQVIHPQPLTVVPEQAPGTLVMEVAAQDDYGVAGVDATLVVAHGNGEQVTFREVHQALVRRAGGRFAGTLDLARAGLAAGVEGYLRFEARDNREPEPGRTRSATLRISVAQAGQARGAALNGGIVLQPLPEMFRSERQIILDTRQLLREAPHLAVAEVQRRTESIGFDQRALRLRYGALLGEEVESGVAVEAAAAEVRAARPAGTSPPAAGKGDGAAAAPDEQEEGHGGPPHPEASQGMGTVAGGGDRATALARALPEGMVHIHDSAESMSFFPDALRREMRQVLTDMWGAEGRLRVGVPREALPFEERALRQLKEVQQRSRAFVPKLGFEAPEIDAARRLTGDLEGVEPQRAQRMAAPADPLRQLFGWSEAACGAPPPPPLSAALRTAGERALEKAALAGDGEALGALAVWRSAPRPGCREARALGAPLWRLLAPPPPAIGRAEAER